MNLSFRFIVLPLINIFFSSVLFISSEKTPSDCSRILTDQPAVIFTTVKDIIHINRIILDFRIIYIRSLSQSLV